MRLFRRRAGGTDRAPGTRRVRGARGARGARRAPSFGELRARLRTEKAEANLLETEIRIHEEAARIRQEIRP